LWAPSSWEIMGCLQELGCSVRETVHPISIGSTKQYYLQQQIRIEIWMGWRIVTVSLFQPDVICILEKKSQQIHKNNNLRKTMVENNIPQSTEVSYPWAIAPHFCSHQCAHAFPQKLYRAWFASKNRSL